MKFVSTRGKSPAISLSHAIICGLAPDGGLYLPEWYPDHLKNLDAANFASYASHVFAPFFENDPLAGEIEDLCQQAFNFDLPINYFKDNNALLELWHGPTAAFKDFGARFLAAAMSRCAKKDIVDQVHILVATSGDTGGAVASAFHRLPGTKVTVLFPKGMVSPRQEKQLTCWGDNVESVRVAGTFDDCQALVKAAFNDKKLKDFHHLSSANSINIGRLLPQMAYHAWSARKHFERTGHKATLVIPTGNLGNAFGAFWARKMGAPIDRIILGVNANKPLFDFYQSGDFQPAGGVATLANAMDVGNPSNLERLRHLHPGLSKLREISDCVSVDDETIKKTIRLAWEEYNLTICPHTAVAYHVWKIHTDGEHCLISATAHPSKFETVVEPLIGKEVPMPENLKSLMDLESHLRDVDKSITPEELLS